MKTKFAELVGAPVSAWGSKPAQRLLVAQQQAEGILVAIAPPELAPLELESLVDPRPPGSPVLRVRKDQKDLTDQEWSALVAALEAIAEDGALPPSWQDIVQVHIDAMSDVGMDWGVHHMGMGMPGEGRNFLAWHRRYVLCMEDRLREVQPELTIPYWNWVNDRELPAALADPGLIERLRIERYPTGETLPTAEEVTQILEEATDFLTFQVDLETGPHNTVHRFVGGNQQGRPGTMGTSASPKDPLFWLHHAMVDNLWAHRQQLPAGPDSTPLNADEVLEPAPIITGAVATDLDIFALGYTYS